MARSKRSSAAILFVIMILAVTTVLTACNSGKNNAADNGEQAKESQNTQAAQSGQANKPPREIKWLLNDAQVPYAVEAKANDPYVQKLSELSGYKLSYEFMDEMTYDEQLTLRYASGDLPDVIFTNSINTHPDALNSGTFLELGALIDKYGPNLKKNIPQEAWESTRVTHDGKIYAIPALGAFTAKQVVYYRQDWLEKLGMQPPVTIDDYLAFFEAVKTHSQELTGSDDVIPFGVRENLDFSELFFGAFGAHPYWQGVWRVRDGQLTPDIIAPEMKDAIKLWKTLYDKGYVNKDMFTTKGADWINRIQSGKTAMWSHNAEEYTSLWAPEHFINQTGVKIGVLGGPVNSAGKMELAPFRSPVGNVFVIPANTKNPEDIIKFFDWAWSAPEAEEFFAYGIEGLNYTKNNGNIEWDSTAPVNADKMASIFYQLVINPRGDGRSSPLVLNKIKGGDKILEAAAIAKESAFKNDGLELPAIDVMSTRPELGFYGGSLFMDMFAKVVSGAEDADKGFDKFVEEWKRRGGDEAIKQATEWFNDK